MSSNGPAKPSDGWRSYTNSNLSEKDVTPAGKKIRTSSWFFTAANLIKMYVGIAFIAVPKSISQAGIYGAIVGFAYIVVMNVFCIYILLKARNRFKREEVVDICDLAAKLYGEWTRPYLGFLLIVLTKSEKKNGVQNTNLVAENFLAFSKLKFLDYHYGYNYQYQVLHKVSSVMLLQM